MTQYCSSCGTEMTFYHQHQKWYCQTCKKYAEDAVPAAAPQPAYFNQPYLPIPDENLARSKIYGAMNLRDSTDKIIPTSWALVILAFQIIMPLLIVLMIYFLIIDITLDLSSSALMAVVIVIFIAAIAMVIIQAVLIFKLVSRRDEHFHRDVMMRQGMIEYLDAMSVKEKKDINVERWTMNTMQYSIVEYPRSPALWAMLVALTSLIPLVGIFALFYSLHFLTKDVHDHDRRQKDFNYQFQLAMLKLGKIKTIHYDSQFLPRRDPGIYVIIGMLTLSFFLPYWWYVNIVDMNTHIQNQWNFESQLTTMIKEEEKQNEIPS